MNIETLKQMITKDLLRNDCQVARSIREMINGGDFQKVYGLELTVTDKHDFLEACRHIEISKGVPPTLCN